MILILRLTYHWGGIKTALTGAMAGMYKATSHMGAAGILSSLSVTTTPSVDGRGLSYPAMQQAIV